MTPETMGDDSMTKMTSDLIALANAGAAIELPVNSKITSDLILIAKATKATRGSLRLINCDTKMTSDLISIAKSAPGRVTFVFES